MAQMINNLPAMQRPGLIPWVMKFLWRRTWQTTAVYSPGEFCGQRRLMGLHGLQRVAHNRVTNTLYQKEERD